MWRALSLFVVVIVCLFSVEAQIINETESKVSFKEKNAEFDLVIENNTSTASRISLELLDGSDKVRAETKTDLRLTTGKQTYRVSMPLGDVLEKSQADIHWYRVRYQVGANSGIISMSQMLSGLFEINVIAAQQLATGQTYRVKVRTVGAFDSRPIAGVAVNAELKLETANEEGSELILPASGVTDEEGFLYLDVRIPTDPRFEDDVEILVRGVKGEISREISEDLSLLGDGFQFPMMTDKPIYQPEQMLHVRGVLLKGLESAAAVAGEEVEFRVYDEGGTVLYREKVRTSDFGIAAFSWKIPENAKLGTYRVKVRLSDGDNDSQISSQNVRISRYELPNFSVNSKALQPYYLPNQQKAEIEVSADYLFGKPVAAGKVRIARENERTWNWKTQQYDIDEGEVREGKTDGDGKFKAEFDLREDHKDLEESEWRQFEDLSFTAYFTDVTTNRTEQRRFDVRITKEPIHVYYTGSGSELNPLLPITSYVSAFYADGSPCRCSVELLAREDDSGNPFKTVLKTESNELGGAKLRFQRPMSADPDPDDDLDIKIIARDAKGLQGTYGSDESEAYWEKDISFEDTTTLSIETEKTIFRPGEPVTVKLQTAFEEDYEQPSARVYVEVIKDWSVIDSFAVNLNNGKGELKIPYQPKYKGVIKIAAYFVETRNESRWDSYNQRYRVGDYPTLVTAARAVVFPHSESLNLDATFDKTSYKPGSEAKVNFGVLDSLGKAVESALGIVIFDKAVEERAITDGDFNGTAGNFSSWLGYGKSFGGINIKDINDLDMSKPVSPDIELAAEIMLHGQNYYPNTYQSQITSLDAKSLYTGFFQSQFKSIEGKINDHRIKTDEHPNNPETFKSILNRNEIDFESLRDPWGKPYRTVFSVSTSNDVLRVISSGPDKTPETDDDITVSSMSFLYFTAKGREIDKKVIENFSRTRSHIRDSATLLQVLGVSEIPDRFGRPYNFLFDIQSRYFTIRIRSKGPDGKTDGKTAPFDDFDVHTIRQDYFNEPEQQIKRILETAKPYPLKEDELRKTLKTGGVDLGALRDGWNEKIYLVRKESSRFNNRVREEVVRSYSNPQGTTRVIVEPITEGYVSFQLRSKGKDKKANTSDDFTLAEFLKVTWEQTKNDPKPIYKPISFRKSDAFAGSIIGDVKDSTGTAISGATINATSNSTSEKFSATSDEAGRFRLDGLATGTYTVRADSAGFKSSIINDVPVTDRGIATLDIVLEVGTVSEVVTVSAANVVQSVNSSMASIVSAQKIEALPISGGPFLSLAKLAPGAVSETGDAQNSTPKLREYFPETLLWSPDVVTGADGKAVVNFKMADSITTWKLYTIASTKDGKFGLAEKEVQAFQPFFVDLDPPKFLTQGDEIYLPTQIRNYTEITQKVGVTMAKADWFSFLDPGSRSLSSNQTDSTRQVNVKTNSAENAVFGFKTTSAVKDGKQRVTAIAEKESDAIEKPVTVRPNGEEIIRTETKLFRGPAQFDLAFPENALAGTRRGELKIYPNLMAHISESVEGLLQRPYGCGEQTISSTYPNLMILKFRSKSKSGSDIAGSVAKQALKNLQKGYEKLLGYQGADGGFTYWGGDSQSDTALTAYALRFLADAKPFVEVDEKVVANAAAYLLKQQNSDGSFTQKYSWETTENPQRRKMVTTYVARTLSMLKLGKPTLDKALAYLKLRNEEIDEPYAIALYALASKDAGNVTDFEAATEKLRDLAKAEVNTVYWNLETNTPFYGWGFTGRIETTALVLQSLLKSETQDQKTKDLISKATLFLLKNKDRFGVWYSTQTTVNVLDAFLASLTESRDQTISVSVNGAKLKDFQIPADQLEPIVVPLKEKLGQANQVVVTGSNDSGVMAQMVTHHYIDWKDSTSTNFNVNDSRAIRLGYSCDKRNPKIMETVTCSVNAERIGFRGYGMLLAEIGIPPGAEVSRESLEKVFKDDWSLSRYEILPDRIIVYMWARPGGSKFNFTFKPRYGIKAKTPASVIYDYYNEESRGTVAPLEFEVK